MHCEILSVGAFAANCVILWDDPKAAWIVDPGFDAVRITAFLEAHGLVPACVVLTHAHFDHIGAIPDLQTRYPGLPVHVGPGDAVMLGHPENAWPPDYPQTDKPRDLISDLTDGVILEVGGLKARILATPGHTPGGVCFHFAGDRLLLSGDTLFAGSCGRTDFPGGSMLALRESLKRLAQLPPETRVICGHGPETTIGDECATNPYLS